MDTAVVFFILIQAALFAGFSAYIAAQKNRSAVTWAVLGFIFGIFAFITIAVIPKVEVEPFRGKLGRDATSDGKPWGSPGW
jgi:hypothetical protein